MFKSGKIAPGGLDAAKDVYEMMQRIPVEIAEKQDAMILKTVQQIGGDVFIRITVDREKVLNALRNATEKQVVVKEKTYVRQGWNCEELHFYCPTCGAYLGMHRDKSYCGYCGQKLGWPPCHTC